MRDKQRLIIGISGASGAIYAIRLLEVLREQTEIETHVVVSSAAKQTISAETDYSLQKVRSISSEFYDNRDIGAAISSGSFRTM